MNTNTFINRRNQLLKKLKAQNTVAVITSHSEQHKSHDTHFPFRQDSHFYYLTGLNEPESLLVLAPHNPEHQSILFLRPKDEIVELWMGEMLGVEEAQKTLGIDLVLPIEQLGEKLPEFLIHHQSVGIDLYSEQSPYKKIYPHVKAVQAKRRREKVLPQSIVNISPAIGRQRLVKSEDELKVMREAQKLSINAHSAVMAFTHPGANERQVQGLFEFLCRFGGASDQAYDSIVAGGNNANVLHYINNNQELSNEDLLLIDAGCHIDYYASDITRTFPINGKFTSEQKDIYQLVLNAQQACIDQAIPGGSLKNLEKTANDVLIQGLIDLEVFNCSLDEAREKNLHKKYYPHSIGHWLGLDVHDNVPYNDEDNNDITFEPGMCFTIEPGLYFNSKREDVPKRFSSIGVRIEDNILITQNGHENLTKSLAKETHDVEEACQKDFRSFLP